MSDWRGQKELGVVQVGVRHRNRLMRLVELLVNELTHYFWATEQCFVLSVLWNVTSYNCSRPFLQIKVCLEIKESPAAYVKEEVWSLLRRKKKKHKKVHKHARIICLKRYLDEETAGCLLSSHRSTVPVLTSCSHLRQNHLLLSEN